MKAHIFLDIDGVLNHNSNFPPMEDNTFFDTPIPEDTIWGNKVCWILSKKNLIEFGVFLARLMHEGFEPHVHLISTWRHTWDELNMDDEPIELGDWFIKNFRQFCGSQTTFDLVPIADPRSSKGTDLNDWFDIHAECINDACLIIDDMPGAFIKFTLKNPRLFNQIFLLAFEEEGFTHIETEKAIEMIKEQRNEIK